eukprot:Awhi_evm2s6141
MDLSQDKQKFIAQKTADQKKYREKRVKNNEAAKKCRQRQKNRSLEIERTNIELNKEMDSLKLVLQEKELKMKTIIEEHNRLQKEKDQTIKEQEERIKELENRLQK